jgi:hypothetical protein
VSDHFVCDQCGELCRKEVFFEGRFKVGESDEEVHHFCSERCKREYNGVADEITAGIERGTRKEINLIYKMVCPKDQERLRRLL